MCSVVDMCPTDVCGVDTSKVVEWRLPSLIYFLTKNRGKYRLPKYRLQDLYYALKSADGIAYCDIFARILRQIRQINNDETPLPSIASMDQSIENFLSAKKRTKSHLYLQKLVSNKKLGEMDAETRARVLSAFIDLLEEEYDIDLDVRFKDNAEETLINAGCDRLGNEYFYIIDDERLYMKDKSGRDVKLVVPPDLSYWDQFLKRFASSDDDNERLLYTMIYENILPVLRYTLTDYTQAFHRPNQELLPNNIKGAEETELRRLIADQQAAANARGSASTPVNATAAAGSSGSEQPGSVKHEPLSVKHEPLGDPSPPHSNPGAPTSSGPIPKYEVDTPGSGGNNSNGGGQCNNPMSVNSAVGSVPPPTESANTPATPNPSANGTTTLHPLHSNPNSVPTPMNCPVSSPLVCGPASVPSNRQQSVTSSLFAGNGPRSDPPASGLTPNSVSAASTNNSIHHTTFTAPPVSVQSHSTTSSVTTSAAPHAIQSLGPSAPSAPPGTSSSQPPPSSLPDDVFAMYPPSCTANSVIPSCSDACPNFGGPVPSVTTAGMPPHHGGQPHPMKLVFTCQMMAEAAKAKSTMGVLPAQYHSNLTVVRQFRERENLNQQGVPPGPMMFPSGPEHLQGMLPQGPGLAGIKGSNENLTPEQLEKRRVKMAQIYSIRERCNLAPDNPTCASTMNGPMPPHNSVNRAGPHGMPPGSCCNNMNHPSNEEAQRAWQKLLMQHQEEKMRQQQMMVVAAKGGTPTGQGSGPSHMGPQGGPVFINAMGPGSGMPMSQVGPPHMPPGSTPEGMMPSGYGPMGPPPHEMMSPHHGGPPQFYPRAPQQLGGPPRRGMPYVPGHPFSPQGHMNPMMHLEPVPGQKRPYSMAGPWPPQGMPPRPGMEMMPQRMPYDPMAVMVDMASGKPPSTNANTGGGGSTSKRRKTTKSSSNQQNATSNASTSPITTTTTTTTTVTSSNPAGPPSTVESTKVSASTITTSATVPAPPLSNPASAETHIQAAPSPSHGQYLNPYDGELTITRHVNSAYQEMNDKHNAVAPTTNPGNPPANGTIPTSVGEVGPPPSMTKSNGSNCSGGSCPTNTQNLTSASLASLARLSNQMPGGHNANSNNNSNRIPKSDPNNDIMPHHSGAPPYMDVSRPNMVDYSRPVNATNSFVHPYYSNPHASQHHMNHIPKEEGPNPQLTMVEARGPPPDSMPQSQMQGQLPAPPPHMIPPGQQPPPTNAYRPPHSASNGGQPVPQGPSPSASQQQLGNANVQVQAKAPNTIQYIPSDPPAAPPSQRGPPRMPPGMYDYLPMNGVENAPNAPYPPGPVAGMHGPPPDSMPNNVRPHMNPHAAPAGSYYPPPSASEVGIQRTSNAVNSNLRPSHPPEMSHAGHSGPYGSGQTPDPFAGNPGPRPHMAPPTTPQQQLQLQSQQQLQQQQPPPQQPPQQQQPPTQQQQQHYQQQQFNMGGHPQHPNPPHNEWSEYMGAAHAPPPPGQPMTGHHVNAQQYYPQQGPGGQPPAVRNPAAPPSVYGPPAPTMM